MSDDAEQFESPDELVDLGPLDFDATSSPIVGPPEPIERTRATIAYCLFGLLAGTIGVLLSLLGAGKLTAQEFEQVCGVVLSPVVALLGAATGYYYGHQGR